MPEVSLSLKEVADIISSTSKAFDELYSTLRRVTVDGWQGASTILTQKQSRDGKRQAKRFVVSLRQLQISKINMAILLDGYSDVEHISERVWEKIEGGLKEILESVNGLDGVLRSPDSIILSSALKSRFSQLVEGLFSRRVLLVRFLEAQSATPESEVKRQLGRIVELLELEAKLIGRCADIIIDFIQVPTGDGVTGVDAQKS